jgi:hypothetical protein
MNFITSLFAYELNTSSAQSLPSSPNQHAAAPTERRSNNGRRIRTELFLSKAPAAPFAQHPLFPKQRIKHATRVQISRGLPLLYHLLIQSTQSLSTLSPAFAILLIT